MSVLIESGLTTSNVIFFNITIFGFRNANINPDNSDSNS